MTFPLRGKDGRFRPFFTLVAPLKDAAGRVMQWFGTNTDVSALHEAQRTCAVAEERLRLATLAGGIGIWDWDIATDRMTGPTRSTRCTGWRPARFGGRSPTSSRWSIPTTATRWRAGSRRRSATASPSRPNSAPCCPAARTKWLSTWARVRNDADGRPVRMVGATISIDAHKRAEAALRDADRRKDEFLAMLAHELRNPLAPISTAAQLLQAPAAPTARRCGAPARSSRARSAT